MAIQSFTDKATELYFYKGSLKKRVGWASVGTVVRRKLDMLHYANSLEDMKSPPNNRLELLRGNLTGLHSIRVNDQWRIIFRWTTSGPCEVRVLDYH